jgi:hypothetical protein
MSQNEWERFNRKINYMNDVKLLFNYNRDMLMVN